MQQESLPLKGWLSLGGLLLLAGLSYGLLRWVESSMQQEVSEENQGPILTVDQFRAVRMTIAGLQEYVLESPRLQQLPGRLGTWIEQPILDWYQANGETREWRLRAEHGWVAADQKVIRLEGTVVMTRAAESGKTPVEVTTRDVYIYPTEQYAETAARARAVTPDGELTTVGVRAWLDREQLELLSEVRGYYEPPKR